MPSPSDGVVTPAAAFPRELTSREHEVLVAMLRQASPHERDVTDAARARRLAMVPEIRVTGECECGRCPSVELVPDASPQPGRLILEAGAPGLGVLLFIDGDRPSYLEGFPVDVDGTARAFPPASELHF
ncbi:MAG: hypothetical protein LWW86_09450 [Micrococcales bacterium]|nr:hypothetical protein [Micrococcales bacterium]